MPRKAIPLKRLSGPKLFRLMARYNISIEEMAALTAHPVKDVKLWLRGLHRVPEGIEILIENKARYVDMLPTALSSFIPVTARGRKLRRPVE